MMRSRSLSSWLAVAILLVVGRRACASVAPIAIDTTSLPAVFNGQGYYGTLRASGGVAPYSWALVSGALPGSMELTPSGTFLTHGAIYAGGQTVVSVRVTDSLGHTGQKDVTFDRGQTPTNILEWKDTSRPLYLGRENGVTIQPCDNRFASTCELYVSTGMVDHRLSYSPPWGDSAGTELYVTPQSTGTIELWGLARYLNGEVVVTPPAIFNIEVPAPTDVTGIPGDQQVTLTWAAVPVASAYRVYSSTHGLLGETSTTTVTIAGLSNDVAQYFLVVSVYNGIESRSAISGMLTPKGAPSGLQSVAADGSVRLSWTAYAGASGYTVYGGLTPGVSPSSAPIRVTTAVASATVTGLTNETTYYFSVTATVSGTETAASPSVAAKPFASIASAPVLPSSATLRVDGRFAALAAPAQASTVFEWTLTRVKDGATARTSTTSEVLDLASLVLKPGVYNVQVAARDSQGRTSLTAQSVLTLILPPPVLKINPTMPLNADIELQLPPGYALTHFEWRVAEDRSTNGAAAVQAPDAAPVSGFRTDAPQLSLARLGVVPGRYVISVTAYDAEGNPSETAQASVSVVGADLSEVRVRPSPWRADRHEGKDMIFEALPSGSTLSIFSVSGRLVRTFSNANGDVAWNLRNDNGDSVASGIYFFLVTDGSGHKVRGKFGIIR